MVLIRAAGCSLSLRRISIRGIIRFMARIVLFFYKCRLAKSLSHHTFQLYKTGARTHSMKTPTEA